MKKYIGIKVIMAEPITRMRISQKILKQNKKGE